MPVFSYTAVDGGQRQTQGLLIAESPAEGRDRLRDQGLTILEFGASQRMGRAWSPRFRVPRRRQELVAELARFLSLLFRAGVALPESLDVLAQGRKDKLAMILKDLRDRVGGGESFSDGLAAHPDWFDPVFVSAVRVGQLSGHLDEALADLAEHLRVRQSLRGQLVAALTYPMILLGLGLGVVVFLMSFVIPQLLTVLTAAGRPLPQSTRLLKGFSDLLLIHWPSLLVGALLAASIVSLGLKNAGVRRTVQTCLLRIPVLGSLIQKNLVSQFAQRMAVLLRTGTPFVDALRIVSDLSPHLVLAGELSRMAQAVESGSDIAPSMKQSRVFPPVVVHLMAVGQDSGELTALLTELNARYEMEVRLAIAKFTSLLEPLLIILLASAVGFVVFACLMPILEATRSVF